MDLVTVNGWLSVATCSIEEAQQRFSKVDDIQLVEITRSALQFCDSCVSIGNLGQLYRFAEFLRDAKVQSVGSRLLFCTGNDTEIITACSFFVGGYMILLEDSSLEFVSAAFDQLSSKFQVFRDPSETMSAGEGLTVLDGWRALVRAKSNGWINFRDEDIDIDVCIDVQEYQHYDNPLNGYLHVIVPARLIAFAAPSNLSEFAASSGAWIDVDGQRFFGAEFYADILRGDFGVELVVRCGGDDDGGEESAEDSSDEEQVVNEQAAASTAYDESAFVDRGMAVERLAVIHGDGSLPSGALLRDVDRFLTLARLAPGAIAIHGYDGPALGCGGELLVSSLLIKCHEFDARSALAWTRMTHPPVVPLALAFSLAPKTDAAAAVPRFRRFSSPADLPSHDADGAADPPGVTDPPGPGVGAAIARCESAPSPAPLLPDAARGVAASSPDVFDSLGLNRAEACR
jgi:hypothetical protein